jgi:hypothetical protein
MNPAFIGSTAIPKQTSGGGGGGGAYSFLTNASANAAGTGTATTSAVNTSGAALIVVSISWFAGTPTLSDSAGNTWTALTTYGDTGNSADYCKLYYCVNPATSASHTFSVHSTATGYPVICVQAFSYSSGTPSLDAATGFNGTGTNTTTLQPGSLTPAGNNELLVTAATWNTHAITSTGVAGYTITNQAEQGSNGISGGLAYLIQSTGSAVNPTWSMSGIINSYSAAAAAFK